MIKDVNGRFDDYSLLPKIRQILLHWVYELLESDLLSFSFIVLHIKMSCYWFNEKQLQQKAGNKYHNGGGKEKAAEYYLKNRKIKKKMQISIKACQKKKKKQKENIKEIDARA